MVKRCIHTAESAGSIPAPPTNIKLSDFCPTDSAARSAERHGNTGSPRTARLAKRRFEIPCDFKYLLCPIKI